ncbi:melanoma-associated antigen C2 [Symphalangus syndactylus]|uniref:melanoma-associated antigen C2 n=1 Tax=Symphalangus syndactylus TaxID=9590 RepID=UPI00244143F8|nr:melanoma-associated antigen C2 [Symphalangus syndactylus]XP_055123968.1 melanoma-associated antigen C2 [Symphalangus syndactylus]XP_055123969.1 melanoma-associated antigen C2 [Symphalangus syndactylus]
MPPVPGVPFRNADNDSPTSVELEDWVDAQYPTDEEEEEASSISSSTFYLVYSHSSFSPSSSLNLGPEEEEVPSGVIPSLSESIPSSPPQSPPQGPSQSPLSSRCSSFSWSPFSEESSSQKEEDTSTCQGLPDSESSFTDTLDEKVAELVEFLLLRYEAEEPVTEAEMLMIVIKYKDYFPVILQRAREFMELLFGLALIEVGPDHFCVFANTVGLTDEGSDDEGMPENSLLIIILSVIFIKGNCASEEAIWEVLNAVGVYAGREHFVYGEPRELLTKVWVQEHYLEYREVPHSSPPRYEFLWGPRAHSESIKRKVLEFLAKLNNTVPSSFPSWYKDALKDVEERAQAIIDTPDDAAVMASESLSVMSSNVSFSE